MHSIKRGIISEKEIAKVKEKCLAWRKGFDELMEIRNRPITEENDQVGLELSEKLLMNNLGTYTVWNYRREIISRKKLEENHVDDEEENHVENHVEKYVIFLKCELKKCEEWLRRDIKSYNSWHHRYMTLKELQTMCDMEEMWDREEEMIRQVLQYDSRNFHCWNYRRLIFQLSNNLSDKEMIGEDVIPEDKHFVKEKLEKELRFTEDKLGESVNFFGSGSLPTRQKQNGLGNYSAWHQRMLTMTMSLRNYHPSCDDPSCDDLLDYELNMVQNMLLIHNGESPWIYLRFLLEKAPKAWVESKTPDLIDFCTEIISLDYADNNSPSKYASLFLLQFKSPAEQESIISDLKVFYPLQQNSYQKVNTN